MVTTPIVSKNLGQIPAKHCQAVANGTSALITSLAALGIGPGDEVLVPPYTFVATINAVLMHHALPVFVDTDLETFQIDARKLEAAITERTACIVPVHLGGAPADMDTILAVARRHNLPVIEDACQAHLAEWRNKKVGTLGLGCFSFQASKNLNSGEGGAIVTNSDDLFEQCKSFQNNGRGAGERGLQLHAQWGESADHGVPGSPFISAAHTTRGTVAPPRTKRGLSHAAIAGDSRNHAGENLRWLHAQCLSSLHVSVRCRPVRRCAAGAVLAGAARGGGPVLRRLPAALQGAVSSQHAQVAGVSGDLRTEADFRVSRAYSMSGQ